MQRRRRRRSTGSSARSSPPPAARRRARSTRSTRGRSGTSVRAGTRSACAEATPISIAPAASARTRFMAPGCPKRRPARHPPTGRRAARRSHRVPSPSRLVERDRAAVLLDERTRDREPEPGAGNRVPRRGRGAEEAREDLAAAPRAGCRSRCRRPSSTQAVAVTLDAAPSLVPPSFVNFTAFETRLSITCADAVAVAATRVGG